MSRESLMKILWGENRGFTLLVLVLVFANICVYLAQTQWLDVRLSDTRETVLERQQALRTLQQQKNAGSMPVSELKQAENDLAQFEKMVPSETKLSEFIGELFGFARSAKLEIKQISYSPEWDDGLDLLRYDLRFSVSGQYRQLKQFIHLLETAERILVIDGIGLSGGEAKKDKDSEVSLQISLKTYFRGDA